MCWTWFVSIHFGGQHCNQQKILHFFGVKSKRVVLPMVTMVRRWVTYSTLQSPVHKGIEKYRQARRANTLEIFRTWHLFRKSQKAAATKQKKRRRLSSEICVAMATIKIFFGCPRNAGTSFPGLILPARLRWTSNASMLRNRRVFEGRGIGWTVLWTHV